MLKNYLTIAIRNLMRHKLYAFINIFGLALGIACCLLMALFVKHEWSHDRFHEHKGRIFRMVTNEIQPDGSIWHGTLFYPSIPHAAKNELPGVVQASGFIRSTTRIALDEKIFQESVGLAGADFLKMFTFPLLAGDPTTALSRLDGIVITEPLAHKFYGVSNKDYSHLLGRPITFPDQNLTFIITGVAAPVPNVSSLQFGALIPIEHKDKFGHSMRIQAEMAVYLRFTDRQISSEVQQALGQFANQHMGKYVADLKRWHLLRESEEMVSLSLQPLTDIYWNTVIRSYYESRGNPTGAYILGGIAILVLLIACSNFMTLSIGQSTGRAREVGIRKVVGAHRGQLIRQFWSEAILLSFLSLVLGIALTELFLPIFNGLIQKQLHITYFQDGLFVLITISLMVVVGLIAGSYPALVLSRFTPVDTLKGQMRIGGRSNMTRILVVLQYAVSIALMICTGMIVKQQNYVQNKILGYDKEHVVVVGIMGSGSEEVAERYKQAIVNYSYVVNATVSDRNFIRGFASSPYELPDGSRIDLRHIRVDPDFVQTMGLTVIDGGNFRKDHPSDMYTAILVNETLVRLLELDNPVGKPLKGYMLRELKEPVIVGVVRDFHTEPLHKPIQPILMQMAFFSSRPEVLIRIRSDDIAGTIAFLKNTWKQIAPDREFHSSFLDENLDRQYYNEQRWQQVLTYASIFAIIISSLGLLGLTSLAVSRRTKEIGIRKVLGASVSGIVLLLSRDFVKLVLIANLIAWPVAYYAMNRWLENFAYRINLGWEVFVLSGGLALLIALLTVSGQAWKAARANPVDALRNE